MRRTTKAFLAGWFAGGSGGGAPSAPAGKQEKLTYNVAAIVRNPPPKTEKLPSGMERAICCSCGSADLESVDPVRVKKTAQEKAYNAIPILCLDCHQAMTLRSYI